MAPDGRVRFGGLPGGAFLLTVSEKTSGLWGNAGTVGPRAERRVDIAPGATHEELVPVDV